MKGRSTTSILASTQHNRVDTNLIFDLIPAGSHVLDIGCGDGALLYRLIEEKNVKGSGIEITEDNISHCVTKGLNVCQADIDEGLQDFSDQSFDYVVLNQTLQVVRKPDLVIKEMLRVGKQVVVGFPNFGYWRVRFQLMFGGSMPRTLTLPFHWYNTPNIHMLTLKDFKEFLGKSQIKTLRQINLVTQDNGKGRTVHIMPNILSEICVFVLQR